MGKDVFFEPWGMGDAVIALSIAIQQPQRFILACNPKWHDLLRAAALEDELPMLVPMEVKYGTRAPSGETTSLPELPEEPIRAIYSVRGDPRDYRNIRRLFPNVPLHMNGWVAFFAKRVSLLNFPYRRGWLPVTNRYHGWADLTDVPWASVEAFYRQRQARTVTHQIAIHLGAQWRSRQYPHVAQLAQLLRNSADVLIVAGPGDKLPEGVAESDVVRPSGADLVHTLRTCSHAITNDSGPMHLAAFLGLRTVCIARQLSLEQWIPPLALGVQSEETPLGYQPVSMATYLSDTPDGNWKSPEDVVQAMQAAEFLPV